ncbi:hypothetical protein ACQPZX_23070 [Actinoplanes sp. CA-142083]|uniref:hypothetical protein n=1 Tax=Actinoplanes sp. CA-142083 TaxID=3239903 RepID=UPI003D89DBF1
MQIVEVSVVGVRSAVLQLKRADTPLRFHFFPMVHIGEPDFYACVADRLRRCDLIVAEGAVRWPPATNCRRGSGVPGWSSRTSRTRASVFPLFIRT